MRSGDLLLVSREEWEPVSVADVREQTRVDCPSEDVWINRSIKAAREYCERNIGGGRTIVAATWQWDQPRFTDPICLSRPPLRGVTSIQYYDENDTLQVLDSSVYRVITPTEQPGRVERATSDTTWPNTKRRSDAVQVTYTAGYASATEVPETLRHAMLLVIAHWFENRETVVVGTISKELEFSVTSLLNSNEYGFYPAG